MSDVPKKHLSNVLPIFTQDEVVPLAVDTLENPVSIISDKLVEDVEKAPVLDYSNRYPSFNNFDSHYNEENTTLRPSTIDEYKQEDPDSVNPFDVPSCTRTGKDEQYEDSSEYDESENEDDFDKQINNSNGFIDTPIAPNIDNVPNFVGKSIWYGGKFDIPMSHNVESMNYTCDKHASSDSEYDEPENEGDFGEQINNFYSLIKPPIAPVSHTLLDFVDRSIWYDGDLKAAFQAGKPDATKIINEENMNKYTCEKHGPFDSNYDETENKNSFDEHINNFYSLFKPPIELRKCIDNYTITHSRSNVERAESFFNVSEVYQKTKKHQSEDDEMVDIFKINSKHTYDNDASDTDNLSDIVDRSIWYDGDLEAACKAGRLDPALINKKKSKNYCTCEKRGFSDSEYDEPENEDDFDKQINNSNGFIDTPIAPNIDDVPNFVGKSIWYGGKFDIPMSHNVESMNYTCDKHASSDSEYDEPENEGDFGEQINNSNCFNEAPIAPDTNNLSDVVDRSIWYNGDLEDAFKAGKLDGAKINNEESMNKYTCEKHSPSGSDGVQIVDDQLEETSESMEF